MGKVSVIYFLIQRSIKSIFIFDYFFRLDKKLSRESNSDTNEEDNEEDGDDEEDEKEKKNLFENKSRLPNQIPEKSRRLQMAEQHRLNGNTAFKSNNYQQAIDLYTNSVLLDKTNPVVYMNRAIACKEFDLSSLLFYHTNAFFRL
jgi:hypothetical protein